MLTKRTERDDMTSRTRAITAVGVLMLVNGLAVGAPWIISEFMSPTEVTFLDTVSDWRYTAFNYLYLAALLGFVAAAPTLLTWRGRGGRTLPSWMVPALVVAATLQACTLFTQAVVTPFLLEVAPIALTTEDGGAFAIIMPAIWIVWIVALVLFAVVGLHRRILPVHAAIAMILGALIIPIFGPIGSILVGAALAWAGSSLRRVAAVEPERTLV
jgi:hypothetical protein